MRRTVLLLLVALTSLSCAPESTEIVVGTFPVEEAELLGHVAARVLPSARVDAPYERREDLLAAFDSGEVHVVVDYLGSLLDHLGVPGDAQGSDPVGVLASLRPADVVIAAPGHAGRGLVVSAGFAGRRGLRSVSGLYDLAAEMVVGGPSDCPRSATCLAGLATVYGFEFGGFIPIDDDDLLAASLQAGEVDAALLFVTDPVLDRRHLVALNDDLGMHVLEAPVLLVAPDVVGAEGRSALSDAFGQLDTEAILGLNLQAESVGRDRAVEVFLGSG